jgi:hypothetical protein
VHDFFTGKLGSAKGVERGVRDRSHNEHPQRSCADGRSPALLAGTHIPLYIVAPEARREKVFDEMKRPLFRDQFTPPLHHRCKYTWFETLEQGVQETKTEGLQELPVSQFQRGQGS